MTYYCGIDLHSNNHYVCVIDDDDNRLFEAKQSNDARLLLAALAPYKKRDEGAYYHVMNRGRGRQAVFHGVKYYESFIGCLEQAHKRFGLEVHAYCLMGNHYHLLVSTPRGSLSRAMRHVNEQK